MATVTTGNGNGSNKPATANKPVTTGKATANKGKAPKAKRLLGAAPINPTTGKPVTKLPNGKPVPKPTSATGYYGVPRTHNLPVGATYAAVLQALVACKATAAGNAVGSGAVVAAGKGTITATNVRHYTYHAQTAGWCGVVQATGGRGYWYYITAKGAQALANYKAGKPTS